MATESRPSGPSRSARGIASRALIAAAAAIATLAASAVDARAYVDPGVGSYILQVVIGTIAAVGFGLKVFWGRIRAAAGRLFPRGPRNGDSGT